MAVPKQPRDELSQPIAVLAPYSPTAVSDTVLAASRSIAIPTSSIVFTLTLTQATWLKFGVTGLTAVADTAGNSLYLPGERTFSKRNFTHVAYVRESADGKISLTSLL